MTGPAYVAYIEHDIYQPRCHAHTSVWSAEQTDDLDAALITAHTHSELEHLARQARLSAAEGDKS